MDFGYVPRNANRLQDPRIKLAAELEAKWIAARDAFHEHLKIHPNNVAGFGRDRVRG